MRRTTSTMLGGTQDSSRIHRLSWIAAKVLWTSGGSFTEIRLSSKSRICLVIFSETPGEFGFCVVGKPSTEICRFGSFLLEPINDDQLQGHAAKRDSDGFLHFKAELGVSKKIVLAYISIYFQVVITLDGPTSPMILRKIWTFYAKYFKISCIKKRIAHILTPVLTLR